MAAGLWSLAAPYALGYASFGTAVGGRWTFAGTWNVTLVGMFLLLFLAWRLTPSGPPTGLFAITSILGGWLVSVRP